MLLFAMTVLSIALAAVVCGVTGSFAGTRWLWLAPVSFAGWFLVLLGLVFLFVLYLCSRVDQSVPQERDDPFYRTVANLVIAAALPLLRVHIRSTGLEKVPTDRRFLLVCNHTNDSDPVILLYAMPKSQLAFISKRENSSMFVIGPMMHKLLCQMINRENDREALKTILRCIQILKDDLASVAVFPEGGIDDDGLLHRFKPGVFKIAQKTGVPVVVCTLKNTKEVIHNMRRFRPSYVEMNVLQTVEPEQYRDMTTVELAHYCHDLMAEDLGAALTAED